MKIEKNVIEDLVEKNRYLTCHGKVASYIPELAKADSDTLGVTIATVDGGTMSVGNCGTPFTLQSISKVVSLMVVLKNQGFTRVFSKVGMEPSGEPFNSISKLETMKNHRPLNPMINSGAIAVASMIEGKSVEARFERVLSFIREVTRNPEIKLNETVYQSEMATGDRNRSLAYFMKSTGVIEENVDEALDLYFRLCSINVTCYDLAMLGVFIANNGRIPGSEKTLLSEDIIKTVNTIMFTAGMYNESGEVAMRVGFPAKSGVSGGILAVVPGKMGIGIIGPAINKIGNSVAGLGLLSDISHHYGLHLLM